MQTSVSSFAFLKDAVISFFSEKDETESIREMLKKVGIIESDVDKQEWDITRDIFKTNLDYGHKVHLRHCIQRVVEISDRVEDTADQLEITIIKGGI